MFATARFAIRQMRMPRQLILYDFDRYVELVADYLHPERPEKKFVIRFVKSRNEFIFPNTILYGGDVFAVV